MKLLLLLLTLSFGANAALIPNLYGLNDTGSQAIKFNDYSSGLDNSRFEMILEAGSYAPNNQMGLYLYDVNTESQVGGFFEIFNGVQSVGDFTNLTFDFNAHSITRTRGSGLAVNETRLFTALDGNLFRDLATLNLGHLQVGVYLNNARGDNFFSHDNLNADGLRHVGIYDTGAANNGLAFGWEDLYGGGDLDYDDMIVKASDVSVDVPEPNILALMGFVILGFRVLKKSSELNI